MVALIGPSCTPVTAPQRGVGATTITPGSVVGHVGVHPPGLLIDTMLVIVPLVAVTFTGIVTSGKYILAGMTADVIHTIVVVPVQIHPLPETVPLSTIPVGRTSVMVVVPFVEAGHSFLARMI